MATERKRKGLLLAPDDLVKDRLVTIHHWRDGREWGLGVAQRILVVNLPYLVVQPLNDAKAGPVTLDVRRVRLMGVSSEFAAAQNNSGPQPEQEIPF